MQGTLMWRQSARHINVETECKAHYRGDRVQAILMWRQSARHITVGTGCKAHYRGDRAF